MEIEKGYLNNLGKVIQACDEQQIPQARIATEVLKISRQAWNRHIQKYRESYELAKVKWGSIESESEKNKILKSIHDYPFSLEEMQNLNQVLRLDLNSALTTDRDPMIFDEKKIFHRLIEEASSKDITLTRDLLLCVSRGSESDLQILRQTADILIQKRCDSVSGLTLTFQSAVRNHVSEVIGREFSDTDTLDQIFGREIEKNRCRAKEKADARAVENRKRMSQNGFEQRNGEGGENRDFIEHQETENKEESSDKVFYKEYYRRILAKMIVEDIYKRLETVVKGDLEKCVFHFFDKNNI